MTTVQLKRIAKAYKGRSVLCDLDLVVPSGSYVVLLGPSGSGKTTTLRLIAGLETPDHGEIEFDGFSVLQVEPRSRDVAMVFQHEGLYPHLTIDQSIRMGLQRHCDAAELETRVTEAVQLAGIEAWLQRYPSGLSGGELRRCAIAKAIARRSSIRLLDEPLSALDMSGRYGLQNDILRWHEAVPGTTIHVTHDGREAMRMADQIAVMDGGKILQIGSPSELFTNPSTMVVAKAIGNPPMNFIPARCEQGELHFESQGVTNRTGLRFNCDQGQRVVVGLRPEKIEIDSPNWSPDSRLFFDGKLIDIREVESSLHLQVDYQAISLNVVLSGHLPSELPIKGDIVRFTAKADDITVFDDRDGKRLFESNSLPD